MKSLDKSTIAIFSKIQNKIHNDTSPIIKDCDCVFTDGTCDCVKVIFI
jgi:hypothetical protein